MTPDPAAPDDDAPAHAWWCDRCGWWHAMDWNPYYRDGDRCPKCEAGRLAELRRGTDGRSVHQGDPRRPR